MALAKSLPSLREELQTLVADNNLSAALTLCKGLLSQNAEKLNAILAMQANLKQLNGERNNGTIDQEKYAIRLAQINQAFLNFVTALEESDFEPPAAKTANTPGKDAHLGSVLYRVPHHMPLAKASICTIRVAIDEDAIVKDIDMEDSDVRLHKQVEVSERMSAELLDFEGKVFDIAAMSAKDQNVRPTGYTQWLFRVTPLLEGEHQLLVKVSLLEFDPNTKEYLPREVSVLETVTVVTATQHSDEEEAPMKSTGQSFVMGPNAVQKDKPTKIPWWKNLTQRGTALFLAFLTFTSLGVTSWAVTPEIKRDWWWATLRNEPEVYEKFIEKHQSDAKGDAQNLLIETAYFRKAERSNSLNDLREYQNNYPSGEFQFREKVLEKIATLEWKEVESIQKDPQPLKIQKYLAHFPDATRLPEVVKAVSKLPAAQQAELLPQVEQAYVQSMEAKPTARKLLQYSRDFPQLTRLNDLAKAAASQPEREPTIELAMEKIVLARVKTASTPEEVSALLPALETLGRPESLEKVEKLRQKNPALQQADLQAEIDEATQTIASAEAQRAEEERQRRAAAEKAKQDSLARVKIQQEAADKAAQTRREQEAAERAEKEQLAREAEEKRQQAAAAEKAEQERLAKEAEEKRLADAATESNLLQPAMVLVKGGTFKMGDDNSEYSYEKPAHAVTLSDFYIAKTEVTQAMWRAVMGNNPSSFKDCDQCPVEQVSWDDVQEFIRKLNAKTNKKYRLPTEAEWEYAARGGAKSQAFTYAGSNILDEVAWYTSNSGSKTHPVGQKKANELGLYDMSGNVYEWCQDWSDGEYYQKSPANNPQGPNTGSHRIYRGGSWYHIPIYARVVNRNSDTPDGRNSIIGFRLARQQ
ncbi:MAG TPA: SUMF1/EgtB/PvdO family nonheme iron enzyme [Haliscomenobacter sp.]|uniref:SUMF1/EgtB/PvdO family nonheme iron enzyme n=1 Tax=Haliscomenobacter sp. TaxID=2717303 RepID=UPI002CB2BAA1|nr:SUMF1/EgtB/PvdO family nonheme iron enzyme [Haliscomenobacter sp.]HOY18121.1 SUMF1/EgtB/PvdO family nonheme iron enzyme [Haliscomenobacter sp.]